MNDPRPNPWSSPQAAGGASDSSKTQRYRLPPAPPTRPQGAELRPQTGPRPRWSPEYAPRPLDAGRPAPASARPVARTVGRPAAAAATPRPNQRELQQSLLERWKMRALALAVLCFGGFWALALGHPVGTAAQQQPQTTDQPQPGAAQPAQNQPAAPAGNGASQNDPNANQGQSSNNGGGFFGGGLFGGFGGGGGGGANLGSGGS